MTKGAYDITSATLSLAWGSLGGKGECLRDRRSNKPWRNVDPIRSLYRSTLARPRFCVLEFKSIREGLERAMPWTQPLSFAGRWRSRFPDPRRKEQRVGIRQSRRQSQPGWRVAVRHPYRTTCSWVNFASRSGARYERCRQPVLLLPRETLWPHHRSTHWLAGAELAKCHRGISNGDRCRCIGHRRLRDESRRDRSVRIAASRTWHHCAIAKGERAGDTMVTAWNLDQPTWESFTDERR